MESHIMRYSGIWRRFAALLVDYLIGLLLGTILFFIVGITLHYLNIINITFRGSSLTYDISYVVLDGFALYYIICIYISIFFYSFLMESSSLMATLGKKLFKLKVSIVNGKKGVFGRIFLRNIIKVIILFPRWDGSVVVSLIADTTLVFFRGSVLTIIFSQKKQTLYDMITGTVVVSYSKDVSIPQHNNLMNKS